VKKARQALKEAVADAIEDHRRTGRPNSCLEGRQGR